MAGKSLTDSVEEASAKVKDAVGLGAKKTEGHAQEAGAKLDEAKEAAKTKASEGLERGQEAMGRK